jgi:hypothetical protein
MGQVTHSHIIPRVGEESVPSGVMTAVAFGHSFREGDLVTLSDNRPWYLRFWHWVCRKPRPVIHFRVTRATETSLDLAPEDDPGYRYHRPPPGGWKT